jgi:hypothetical protein
MEWHAAVRASVSQGKRAAGAIATYDEGNFKQRGLVQLFALHLLGG